MSKPDPAGGSLESILASIRKNLSEQSTDVLSEPAAAPVRQDKDAKPSRKQGLTQRLAGAAAGTLPGSGEQGSDDLSDLLEEEPSGKAARKSEAAPSPPAEPAAAPGENDPLWFLTRRDDSTPEAELPSVADALEVQPESQNVAVNTAAPEPKLTRPEVLRASMPPFFGSSAEAAKTPSAPADAGVQAASRAQVTPPGNATPAVSTKDAGADATIAREVSLIAAAAETAATRPAQPAPQPQLNGKGPTVTGPSPDATLAGDRPLTRALEAMVLDLLKPMLSQWLDQNMPRLVAEALSEEVQRTRTAARDAKNT